MLRKKIIVMVFIIFIILCMASFGNANAPDGGAPDLNTKLEESVDTLFRTIRAFVDKVFGDLDDMIGAVLGLIVIFIVGIILLCICAPCVYIFTSCIETCTHCCSGNKETRAMKRLEKFKYFNERIGALESMNGIKTEIEIVEKDSQQPETKDKKRKGKDEKDGKKGKDGGKKDVEKSVGVSVEKQDNKSVQKSL